MSSGNSQGGALDLGALFGTAGLSQTTFDNLTAVDLGSDIQSALGTPIDVLKGSEAFFFLVLLDDSSSMFGNAAVVVECVNGMRQAIVDSKSVGNVLMLVTTLNHGVIFPLTPITLIPPLTTDLYTIAGQTPLFDGTYRLLGTAMTKVEQALLSGMASRCHSVVVSDGAPFGAQQYKAQDVAALVKDMDTVQPESHIVYGMGIDDGRTNFRALFNSMGIGVKNPNHILTPGNSPHELRAAFEIVSRSAATASQGAAGFSKALSGS